ncbi:hypothetical protein [Falsiroseomonas oryziterrae]|uniref:hypothetical protein n=1 Tax=Falsiroseomonas oryziterrae TaxID=2911368 RepID=UPI001F2C5D5C|nr:hypothetical protein [Roseomonas sp. NPKOSM-4]
MGHRGVTGLLVAALLAGCAEPPSPERPEGEPLLLPAPPPSRRTLADRIRQDAWITRFWEQLTPAQRRRVVARLRLGNPPLATEEAEAAPIWDTLGLAARDALIFGPAPRRGP